MFSGGKNSSELYVADLKFTGHKASAVILPAVCQCKVYCNDNFSGVHVRSAVGDTAPKKTVAQVSRGTEVSFICKNKS